MVDHDLIYVVVVPPVMGLEDLGLNDRRLQLPGPHAETKYNILISHRYA